jgi:hypothetical protein
MVKEIQFRRGSTTDHISGVGFTGALAEVTVDTTNRTLRVHDGSTKGGHELVGVAATQRITNKDIEATTLIVSGVTTLPNVSRINVTGVSTVVNGPLFVGSATSTGTASQRLQVTGGAYVSGTMGIGTASPTSSGKLEVYTSSLNDANPELRISGLGWMDIHNSLGAGAYNPIVSSGDKGIIFSNVTGAEPGTSTGNLVIAPWSSSACGIRINSFGEVLVATSSRTGTASQRLQVDGGAYVSGVGVATGSIGVGITNPQGALDIRTSPQWSSFNYGANLVIGGTRNNGIGILDSTNSNPWAIVNSAGTLLFAQMPALGNTASVATEAARITTNRNLLIGSITETGTASQALQITGGGYFSENTGIGSTNPTAELHIQGTGSAAASSAPLKISVASPTLLTTPESGAFEYDRVLLYHTNDDTTNANRRALIPEIQFIRRPDSLSINDTTSPGTSFFGATNRPALLGGYIYEIEAVVFITKVTNAGTVTVQASLSTGNFTFATLQASTASNAIVVGGTTSPVTIFTSASLTAGTSHGITIKGLVQPVSNSRFDLLALSSTATITALANSYMKVTCVGTGTTIGNFG